MPGGRREGTEREEPGSLGAARRGEELLGVWLAGRYRLDQVVRRGAGAIIYRASDRLLHRRVAVKLVWTADVRAAERLAAEGRIHSLLHHPSIPLLLDAFDTGPVRALVMEHVDGTDLDEILRQLGRPMVLSRIRVLIAPILSALEYLHAQRLVHRDVKPANILVFEHRLRERSKLCDFGVAGERGRWTGRKPELITGTLLYMSPEHFEMPGAVDERADIYSLGVTLFQMATGTVPFYARTARSVMRAHLQSVPPSPRSLNPSVGPALEALILKALEKDPLRRFQQVSEVAAALEEVREEPLARWSRWRRRLSTHRLPRPRRWLTTTQVPTAK